MHDGFLAHGLNELLVAVGSNLREIASDEDRIVSKLEI